VRWPDGSRTRRHDVPANWIVKVKR
jgi:hypothetical protein